MKQRIDTFLLFLLVFCYSFCLEAQTKEWTLLIYMTGTDIVDDAITDIGEISAAGNTDNIHIVGLFGGANRAGWETPTSSTIVDGVETTQSFVPSVSNMAHAPNITEFVNWGIENYPAEKYMLLFYNHGMDIRGFGWDETVDKQLSVAGIQGAIDATDFITNGNKFEVLGFDACLMASFEVMSAMRNFAHYYVASEETEPYHAWNWTPIITAMNTQAGLTGGELGEIIVDNYFAQSASEGTKHVTLSVTDLTKITALETAVENLVLQLNDDLYLQNFLRARAASEEYGKSTHDPEYSEDMTDLGDLVDHLLELEPGLAPQTDAVFAALDDAVVYARGDSVHPLSTGISLYVPFHVIADPDETADVLNNHYLDVPFSATIKNFIAQDFTNYALADDEAVTGGIDPDFGNFTNGNLNRDLNGFPCSAIKIPRPSDLDQIQVILLEEIEDIPSEYLLLGSTYPDTSVMNADNSITYAHAFDSEWLGLNGHPAYVADIHYVDVRNEAGDLEYEFTRVHIPAVRNRGTAEEMDIMFTFTFDADFNHQLESILQEPYGEAVMVPSKERIQLQAGDQIHLLYEVFNSETHEAFYVVDEDAVIDIENGNADLSLEHDPLEPGLYHLGFVLTDHAQNDTIIYDPTVFEVVMVDTEESELGELPLVLGPNPTPNRLNLSFATAVSGTLEVRDAQGRTYEQRTLQQSQNAALDLSNYPAGTYWLSLQQGGQRIFTRQIIKQ